MIEEKLPLHPLNFKGRLFLRRPGLLVGPLTKGDEGVGVPFADAELGFANARGDVLSFASEIGKDGVRTYAAKPIGRVAGIRFLAMHNGVPKLTVLGGASVGELMRLLEARKIQPQSGHGGVGVFGLGE
jgi:hypothetical protein